MLKKPIYYGIISNMPKDMAQVHSLIKILILHQWNRSKSDNLIFETCESMDILLNETGQIKKKLICVEKWDYLF